jgi:arylsulfatase A-like enzyme
MMPKTLPLPFLGCSAVIALIASCGMGQLFAVEGKRPNVLFLFTDDQRADAIGVLGNPHIATPNLDRLATEGFVFDNAYCLGSNVPAVCLPSRNMLLCGRAYFRFAATPPAAGPTFPKSLKAAGYETYHHGKLGNSAREIHKQFDHTRYVKDDAARKSGEPGSEIVDAAIEFLKERFAGGRKSERRFFMYLAFAVPHDPRVAAKKYLDRYDRDKIPLPQNYRPVHPFDNGEMIVRDERLAPWPRSEAEIRRHLHDYYAVITGLDGHIGRLLAALKELGQYENTLIIFSSDHGLALGSHGLMGKQNLYEDGMKVPLMFAGPGVPKGRSDALCYLMDIYPTVCELAGMEVPKDLDGLSLAPVIAGRKRSVRDSIFLAYRDVQRAVRDDRWKLIRYPQINKSQLFDLANDPHERHDLSGDAENAGRMKGLSTLMQDWQRRLGDKTPLSVEKPRDWKFKPPAEK